MIHASWDTLTVAQFLDLYRLSINTSLDEMDKLERAVAIIYNKSEREVEDMKMGEFTLLSSQAGQFLTTKIPGKPVKYISVGKHKYRITYDPTKLRHRQYVEVVHFGAKPIENMHLIMASVVQPVKFGLARKNTAEQHPVIASDMLQAPVKEVYHACVFFCKLYASLIQATQVYLEREVMMSMKMTQAEASQLVKLSLSAMAGFIQQPELQNIEG